MKKNLLYLSAAEERCNIFFAIMYTILMAVLAFFSAPVLSSLLGNCLIWVIHVWSLLEIDKRRLIIAQRREKLRPLRKH